MRKFEVKAGLILKMEGISRAFPGVQALSNVNFEVKKGKSIFLPVLMAPENQP